MERATTETSSLDAKPKVRRLGLRLQILLALAGVMLVAYVPLFFAIAQVTRASSLAYREEAARAIGRAVAAHVADIRVSDPASTRRVLDSHVGEGGALAGAVYGSDGAIVASAGAPSELDALRVPSRPYGEATTRTTARSGGRALDVVLPAGDGAVLVRVRTDEDVTRTAGIVRVIALYMGVFALALLVFAYIALTRAIVRPIEQLGRAADRVANGARTFDLPNVGAREVADLGASVRSMAARLLSDENAMRNKVEELTNTTRRLSETREQLMGSERMASVGKLAAGVAHEIGNPIAAIMGMHDLMDDDGMTKEEREDFLRRMRKETERINGVVRDLLDFARPESGPVSMAATSSVTEVVADVIGLLKPQKSFRSVDVTLEVDDDARVRLSAQRLTQVLLNLALNAASAMDASPEGERKLRISAKKSGDHVRIEVEDVGPGVPESIREKIFDPFVTTKDVGAGTGLGLAVCRGIVEGAGGSIAVDASYTAGARFVVTLPRVG